MAKVGEKSVKKTKKMKKTKKTEKLLKSNTDDNNSHMNVDDGKTNQAKVGEKRVKKTKKMTKAKKTEKLLKSNTDDNNTLMNLDDGVEVMYDDDNEEEDDPTEDIPSEDEQDDDRRRQKLLDAIGGLSGKRHKLGERSEAAPLMSEFTVSAEGEGGKVQLSDLLGEKTAVPGRTIRQLKNLQQSRTLESPLSRQESERIQRDVAFQKAALEVSRWKGVIYQNRRAEQVVFPLNQEPSGPRPMERVVMGWRAQTPLEQEIFAVLTANKQPVFDPVLTPAEKASVQAMNLEDAKIRRAELQKVRALQSYYEAKTRRDRKIKSKKFHKVQNKSKRKELLNQFEEKVKSDPAAALEQLEQLERNRMQERMSLKHQNSSKWAKSRVIVAKYDLEARRAMQEQLQLNRDLTQKAVLKESDDEVEEEEQEKDEVPDFVNEVESDSVNPWMRGRLREEEPEEKGGAEEEEGVSTTVGTIDGQNKDVEKEQQPEVEEEEEEKEEVMLREFDQRRRRRKEEAAVEEEQLSQFNKLYQEISEERKEVQGAASKTPSKAIVGGLTRVQTMEEVEMQGEEVEPEPQETELQVDLITEVQMEAPPPLSKKKGGTKRKKVAVELSEVLTKGARLLSNPLPAVLGCEEESLDQRGVIREAFAGDDVIRDFLKEKRKNDVKPAAVNLALPGWGEWGGTGLKPSKRKRLRFRVKPRPVAPRKDQKLPATIISEKRNSVIAQHQVSSLPFPFADNAHFQSTIRSPLGRTWNTERTVRKMTSPRVVTLPGRIIEPMSRDELLKDSKHKKEVSGAKKLEGLLGERTTKGGERPVRKKKRGGVRKNRGPLGGDV